MYEGNWTQAIYIDERADDDQRRLLEEIFTGEAGGVWEVLAQFIGKRMETRYAPIRFQEDGKRKSMQIEGMLETHAENLRGADKGKPVLAYNMINRIHGNPQTLALGSTHFEDHGISLVTRDTHAIISEFSWRGP